MSRYEKKEINVAVLGQGGREHALVWKIAQSPRLGRLYALPGSDAIGELAENIPMDVTPDNIEQVVLSLKDRGVDFVIPGPENYLAWGFADIAQDKGLGVFGPNKAAAQLEASKIEAYRFGLQNSLPFPPSESAKNWSEAAELIDLYQTGSVVVKADGLCAGKGVFKLDNKEEARKILKSWMVDKTLGEAGRRVLFQKFTPGKEFSAIALCSGTDFKLLPFAADHKALLNDGKGPNTGGMGTYSPVEHAEDSQDWVSREVFQPTLRGLAREGRPFTGFLYAGCVKSTDDNKYLYEFNVRMGDPEAQVILPRLSEEADLLSAMWAATFRRLNEVDLPIDAQNHAVCVVMASDGYPGKYELGQKIQGLDNVPSHVQVFHAGTKKDQEGNWLTNGGRVLGVTAVDHTKNGAREKAYIGVSHIRFNTHYRTDIGAAAD